MTKIDRDKTRKINALVISGIDEIRSRVDGEKELKILMEKYGLLSGEVRKIILSQDVEELKLSVKYMLIHSVFEITKSEKYNLETFYNNKIKLKFLHRYPSNTQTPYARILEKSLKYEDKYNKDLSLFTLSELENVLYELEPLTESASHVNGRIISTYIDWCIDNSETSAKNNELKTLPMDYFIRFVDKELELYFTRATIEKINWDCKNPQDAVIIKLLFEGIQGESLSEIRNIKKEHVRQAIDNNNILIVYNEDNSKRKVKLTQSTMDLLEKAMIQEEYVKRNGDIQDESVGLLTNLVSNDYVIRTSITRTDEKNRPVDKMVIYRKIKMINEVLGYPYLTAKNIVRSGIIYEASRRIKNGVLTKEDYLEICAIYNIENWYPVKKYCNPEIIKKLYKEECTFV
jgi:hypothetical protein